MDIFAVVQSNWYVKVVHIWTPSLWFSGSHMLSADFTHLIICRDSNTVVPQRYTSSVLERLFRPGLGCKPSGCWIAPEAEDAEIKGAHLLPSMWHWDMYRLIIQISRSILWGGGKMEASILFIIIKIWLFLCFPSLLSTCSYSAPAVLMKPTSQIRNLLNYFQLSRHRCFYQSP